MPLSNQDPNIARDINRLARRIEALERGLRNQANDAALALSGLLVQAFGDGSDGDVTISGSTTLTADMFYNSLRVTSGGTLNTGGFRIYVKTICQIDSGGAIRHDGLTASSRIGASGASQGSFTAGSGAGGNGANGNGSGNAGTGASVALGGDGGDGNTSGFLGGGPGGNNTAPTGTQATYRGWYSATTGLWLANTVGSFRAGAGGGGGASAAGTFGGGGGSGGGLILLAAGALVIDGTVSAVGGGGAAGGGGNSGGGGGGGGGVIYLTYGTRTGSGSVTVAGGSGGAGTGLGGTGVTGSVGVVFELPLQTLS